VSRTQALVKSDGVRHTIINLSQANPILVNGREIETNCEYGLKAGDQIQIGLYLLRAEVHADASAHADGVELLEDPPAGSLPLESDTVLLSRKPGRRQASAADAAHPSSSSRERRAALEMWPIAPAPDASPAEMFIDHRKLIQAFLNGAGIPDVTLPHGLTPEFMEMIGKLLAISVQGSMDLSALRALVKREANADVTMVVVRNNNPLKFLPDGETVLTQMFRKKMPGFMSPAEAMEDMYEDLHAHQLGMVAGMRASLAELLKRLHPEALEKKAKRPSFLESLLPANRKAGLWDLYSKLYRQINAQAQDDFQMLFGQAFLQAYEREVEHFKSRAAR
jgi:FHA domain-containing protein